ncbi:palmitoyltransferase ZDHHC9/14/18 [Nematocida sp. AWRm77]|nr:palmitoyltransferase ZDHHC9/14/18 [Nematocida sp. AWRm77]
MQGSKYVRIGGTFTLLSAGIVLGLLFTESTHERVWYLCLSAYTMGLLVQMCLSDPGVLCRQTEDYKRKVLFSTAWYEVTKHEECIVGRTVFTGSKTYSEKFCTVCGIFCPLHVTHCRECRVCVAEMDHHCPWLNNCIGEQNYQEFMSLLTAESVRGMVVFFFRARYGAKPFQASLDVLWNYFSLCSSFVNMGVGVSLWGYFVLLFLWGTTAKAFWRRSGQKEKIIPKAVKKNLFYEYNHEYDYSTQPRTRPGPDAGAKRSADPAPGQQ